MSRQRAEAAARDAGVSVIESRPGGAYLAQQPDGRLVLLTPQPGGSVLLEELPEARTPAAPGDADWTAIEAAVVAALDNAPRAEVQRRGLRALAKELGLWKT